MYINHRKLNGLNLVTLRISNKGHYGFRPSFPIVYWFYLFADSWVSPFLLEDCTVFGTFVITLFYVSQYSSKAFHYFIATCDNGFVSSVRGWYLFYFIIIQIGIKEYQLYHIFLTEGKIQKQIKKTDKVLKHILM